MDKLHRFFVWLFIDPRQSELALAQFNELKTKIPFNYGLLVLNAIAVSYTHYDKAPLYLTVGVFIPIVMLTVVRLYVRLRDLNTTVTPEQAVVKLRSTLVFSAILAIVYTAWSMSLDQYGGPAERGHIALFLAITTIGCLVCLVHVPQAVIIVMSIVTIPYLVHYFSQNEKVFIAIAINIFLISIVIARVLFSVYNSFRELFVKNNETKRLNEENEKLSLTDELTGLSNRRHFFKELESRISTTPKRDDIFAVGVIDLDYFKSVNDTYGHKYGDQLLKQVAARLATIDMEGFLICRLGGDEFGFIYDGDREKTERLSNLISKKINMPFLIEDISVNIGSSCGVALYPETGESAHDLFDKADYALYYSKSNTKGVTTFFSQQHDYLIETQRGLEMAMKCSDFAKEFQVFLQPIFATHERHIVGFEALSRWNSPRLGFVPPDRFIEMAERLGLINKLTQCLFEKALDHLPHLPMGMYLSFNLSAHDITSPETVDKLLEIVVEKKIDPQLLMFEITETSVVDNLKVAEYCINKLQQAGAAVALDDFGTGYSSLGYLHKLNFDIVKIDRSFVSKLKAGSDTSVILSILNLCRSLNIPCVVEGVETMEQLLLLESMHCHLVQGYYFSPPLPIEKIDLFLKENESYYLQNNSARTNKEVGELKSDQSRYSLEGDRMFRGELIKFPG